MSTVSIPPMTRPITDTAYPWRRRLLTVYIALLPVMVVRDLPLLGSRFQLTELVFGALFVSWIVPALRDRRALVTTPLAKWLAVWLAVAAVSTALALHIWDSVAELAAWGYLAAVYVVIVNVVDSWDDWRRLVRVWVIASTLAAVLILVGVVCGVLWDVATPFAVQVDPFLRNRLLWVGVGLFWAPSTPNLVVGYLLAGSILALGLMWASENRQLRWLAGIAAATHAAALALTISRGWIAVGLALLVFMMQFRSYAAEVGRWIVLVGWLLLVVAVEILSFYQAAGVSASISWVPAAEATAPREAYDKYLLPDEPLRQARVEAVYAPAPRPLLNLAALEMWRERPWLGVGPGGFAREIFERQRAHGERWNGLAVLAPWDPHSTYFGALAEIGILGALSVIVVFGAAIRQTLYALRRNTAPLMAPLLWAVLAVIAGYVVAAKDDDLLTKRWLWSAAGLSGSAYALTRRGEEAPPETPEATG